MKKTPNKQNKTKHKRKKKKKTIREKNKGKKIRDTNVLPILFSLIQIHRKGEKKK